MRRFIIRAVKIEMKTTSFHQFHRESSLSASSTNSEPSAKESKICIITNEICLDELFNVFKI
jgi:hypothetical protein